MPTRRGSSRCLKAGARTRRLPSRDRRSRRPAFSSPCWKALCCWRAPDGDPARLAARTWSGPGAQAGHHRRWLPRVRRGLSGPRRPPSAGRPRRDFDRLTFRGSKCNVGDLDGAAAMAEGIRFADVELPADRSARAKSGAPAVWSTPWSRSARVVLLGSSHALMYAGMIDDVCQSPPGPRGVPLRRRHPRVLSDFPNTNFPTVDLARDFDDARRRWIAAWKPDVLIVVDRWDHYPATLDGSWLALRQRLRLPRDSPWPGSVAAHRRDGANLRDYVTWPWIRRRSCQSSARCARADPAGVTDRLSPPRRDFPRWSLFRVDQPFYNEDGSIRFADGRRFLYADDDHLSDAGASLVRETWRRGSPRRRALPDGQGTIRRLRVSRAMSGGSFGTTGTADLTDSAECP